MQYDILTRITLSRQAAPNKRPAELITVMITTNVHDQDAYQYSMMSFLPRAVSGGDHGHHQYDHSVMSF